MSKAATINLKVDPKVKEQAKEVFDELGLDMSTAINLFLRQAIRANGLPFPLLNGGRAAPGARSLAWRPEVDGAGVHVPADWDDPEDAVYDDLYGA